MEYLTRDELVRLFKVARNHNKLHHVAMLVGLLHGLRVSEMLATTFAMVDSRSNG